MTNLRIIPWKLLLVFLIVYVVSFCIILPIIGCKLPFSAYYISTGNEEKAAIERNKARIVEAEQYLKTLDSTKLQQLYSSQLQKHVDVTFAILTKKRRTKMYTGYLIQVISALQQQLSQFKEFSNTVIICNTEKNPHNHTEASIVEKYYPFIHIHNATDADVFTRREQEKIDFTSCLESVYSMVNFTYVVVLQDDAVPRANMLEHLNYIIKYKLEKRYQYGELVDNTENWAYIRLFYPDVWQGYEFRTRKIFELLSFGFLFGGLSTLVMTVSHKQLTTDFIYLMFVFTLLVLYGILFPVLAGRHYIIEFRRISSQLLSVIPANRCCMPAALYPKKEIPRIVKYLHTVTCSSDNPLDLVLADFASKRGFKTYLVEPNLFQHIGMYSTLTKPKDAKNFQK